MRPRLPAGGTVVDDDAATTELPQEVGGVKVVAFRGVGAWLRSWVGQEGEHETPLEVFPATDDEEAIRGFAQELSPKPGFDLMPEIREDVLWFVQWKDGCLHSLHMSRQSDRTQNSL